MCCPDLEDSRVTGLAGAHINGATAHDEATAPFGGVKRAGWGRFGAGQVASEFSTQRWITVFQQARHYRI